MYVYACVFSQIEHDLLRSSFAALAQQMDLIFRKRLWFIMVEQFLMKYMWGLAGTCGTHTHTHTHTLLASPASSPIPLTFQPVDK